MESVQDLYRLEDIGKAHQIDASVFVPFAVVRLRAEVDSSDATLEVQLRNLLGFDSEVRQVRIVWSDDSVPEVPLAVQDRTITEWAACGVACVLVPLYSHFRILNVAAYGDGFDYWLNDGRQEYALEISGTATGELEPRHRSKVSQLLANPHGIDGYVAVIAFGAKSAVFSFHRFQEASE